MCDCFIFVLFYFMFYVMINNNRRPCEKNLYKDRKEWEIIIEQ